MVYKSSSFGVMPSKDIREIPLWLQQNLARARSAGMGNGFDTLAQRVNLLNQRRNRNAPFSQRIQRRSERAAAGTDDGDLVDHQRRKRNFVLAGNGGL